MSSRRLMSLYRNLLRVYPHAWREQHEDELLDVLDQGLREHGRRRAPGEALALVAGGLRLRSRGLTGAVAVGQRAALLALVSGTALALVMLGVAEVPVPGVDPFAYGGLIRPFGPFMTTGVVPQSLWLLAFLALVVRQAGCARVLVLAAGATGVLLLPLAAVSSWDRPPLFVLVVLAAFATLAGWRGIDVSRRARTGLGIGVLTLVVWMAAAVVRSSEGLGDHARLGVYFYRGPLHAVADQLPVLLLAAVVVAALLSRAGRPWFLPVLAAGVPWMYLVWFTIGGTPDRYVVGLVTVSAALALVLGAVLASRLAGVRVRLVVERAE